MGASSFKQVDPAYEPDTDNGERWVQSKKDRAELAAQGKKASVEIIEEAGVCNDYRFRDQVNIIYFQDLQDNWPAWPTRFAPGGGVGGLGLL